MTKAELIAKIAEDAGITKKQAGEALKAFTSSITDALAKGDSVKIKGFGTFSVSQRAARTGRNPQTGAKINIAAKKVPKFKAESSLKRMDVISILTDG